MGHSESSPEREVQSITGLPKEARKSQRNYLTLHLKALENQQQQNKAQSKQKEGNNKDQNRNKWHRHQ